MSTSASPSNARAASTKPSAACTLCFFFFTDTATTEIYTPLYTLTLHDALPIYPLGDLLRMRRLFLRVDQELLGDRSEEHTSELQSHSGISYAVFCLKKKKS